MTTTITVTVTVTVVVTVSQSYLVYQNFEGTGFDNGETWITYAGNTGAADPNYTTNPLLGSQSLHMKDDDDEGTYAVTKFADDTGYNELYGFFRFKILDYPASTKEVMQTYNLQGALTAEAESEVHEMIWVSSAGVLQFRIEAGTNVNGTTELQLNTLYYVWWYMVRSVGMDSTGWIKVATTTTIPESNEIAWTDVDVSSYTYRGTNIIGFTTFHGDVYEYVIDQVMVDDAPFGSIE